MAEVLQNNPMHDLMTAGSNPAEQSYVNPLTTPTSCVSDPRVLRADSRDADADNPPDASEDVQDHYTTHTIIGRAAMLRTMIHQMRERMVAEEQ